MLSAGIKINYGKIDRKMGEPTTRFVQKAVSFIDSQTRDTSRIRISTKDVGSPVGPEGMCMTNIHAILKVAVKKAGIKNLLKNWKTKQFEKSALDGLFSYDNFVNSIKEMAEQFKS